MGLVRPLLFINGPRVVIVLYWVSDGSCYYILQVLFLVELFVQRRLYLIFIKLWVLVKGTQRCGIGLPNIHKFSTG